ncbi:MAG TPA: hypothetical protein VEW07_03500 [Solirubrobacterales bacterium]|nr:hypothetical protein [Solirubrobacterales bacterium]
MPLFPTIDQQADAMERLDGGQRLAVVLAGTPLGPTPETREPLNRETVERVADCIATARGELMAAMKHLFLDIEQQGASDLHMRVGFQALDLDEILRLLAEGYGS